MKRRRLMGKSCKLWWADDIWINKTSRLWMGTAWNATTLLLSPASPHQRTEPPPKCLLTNLRPVTPAWKYLRHRGGVAQAVIRRDIQEEEAYQKAAADDVRGSTRRLGRFAAKNWKGLLMALLMALLVVAMTAMMSKGSVRRVFDQVAKVIGHDPGSKSKWQWISLHWIYCLWSTRPFFDNGYRPGNQNLGVINI